MAIKLPRFDNSIPIVSGEYATNTLHQWWQKLVKTIEAALNDLQTAIDLVAAAQAAADAAQAAADTAQAAAEDAQAAADDAQSTADDVQDQVDNLVIPPTDSITVSTNTALSGSEATVFVDTSGGAVTITLAAAASFVGSVAITKTDATVNAVNVVPSGGDTLNGGAGPVAIVTQYENHQFSSDNASQWFG